MTTLSLLGLINIYIIFSLSFFSLFFLSLSLSLFFFSYRSDDIELDFKEISYLVWFSVNFFIRNRSNKTVQHPGTELREPKHVQTSINWRYLQKFTYLARGISDSKTENSSNWHYLFQGDVKKGGANLNWLCWLKNIYTKPSKFAIANCIEIVKFNTKKDFGKHFFNLSFWLHLCRVWFIQKMLLFTFLLEKEQISASFLDWSLVLNSINDFYNLFFFSSFFRLII